MKKVIILTVCMLGYTLLNAQVYSKLTKDFSDGNYYYYNSKGHIKSNGINLRIKIPNEFNQEEGNRPHIVQKFTYTNDSVQAVIILIIGELEYAPSEAEKKDVFVKDVRSILYNTKMNYEYIGGISTTIDGLLGSMITVKTSENKIGIKIISKSLFVSTIYSNKLIQFMFTVSPMKEINNSVKLDSLYTQFELLFKLITNSIIIDNQWK